MKKWLYKWFVKNYLKIFHPQDVILVKKSGEVFVGGKLVSEQQLKNYQENAQLLKNNDLLKTIIATIRAHAENQVMYHGTDEKVIHNNRMVLYTLAQIEKMVGLLYQYEVTLEKRNKFFETYHETTSTGNVNSV